MKSWKKRWQEELDQKIPKLSDGVKNTPVSPSTEEIKERGENVKIGVLQWIALHKKRFYSCVASCMAAIVCVAVAIPIALQNTPTAPNTPTTSTPPVTQTVKTAAISVEINPSAVFSVDETGKVAAVVATNADADVILSDEGRLAQMQGKMPEEAVQVFVDYAAKLGYLDLSQTAAVRISTCGNEAGFAQVGDKISEYFREKGAYAAVIEEAVSYDTFCERTGLPAATDIQTLVDNVKELHSLFTDRAADGKTEEQRKALYQEVLADEIAAAVEKALQDNVAYIREKLLEELPEFIPDRELIVDGMLSSLDAKELLEKIGVRYSDIAAWLEIPETEEQYAAAFEAYFVDEFANRTEEYRAAYEETREYISEEEYERFLNDLRANHGSLDAFWEGLQEEK